MNFLTVFFDVGRTLQDTTSLFEAIAKRLTGAQPDQKTRDLFSDMFLRLMGLRVTWGYAPWLVVVFTVQQRFLPGVYSCSLRLVLTKTSVI
jgi:hypothetical protein